MTAQDGTSCDTDEGIRRGGTVETLASLQPAFKPDGVITAGNTSQISDGAAALLVCAPSTPSALGLRPIARVHTAVLAARRSEHHADGAIPATQKALQRAGLALDDIGAFEITRRSRRCRSAWLHETGATRPR